MALRARRCKGISVASGVLWYQVLILQLLTKGKLTLLEILPGNAYPDHPC